MNEHNLCGNSYEKANPLIVFFKYYILMFDYASKICKPSLSKMIG